VWSARKCGDEALQEVLVGLEFIHKSCYTPAGRSSNLKGVVGTEMVLLVLHAAVMNVSSTSSY
jgi:hypothetical protein